MCYNHSNEYFGSIYFCVFIKKSKSKFVIIVVYIDDLNISKTYEELPKVIEYLKKEFEMKGFRK